MIDFIIKWSAARIEQGGYFLRCCKFLTCWNKSGWHLPMFIQYFYKNAWSVSLHQLPHFHSKGISKTTHTHTHTMMWVLLFTLRNRDLVLGPKWLDQREPAVSKRASVPARWKQLSPTAQATCGNSINQLWSANANHTHLAFLQSSCSDWQHFYLQHRVLRYIFFLVFLNRLLSLWGSYI